MPKQMFVNLPIQDLDKSMAFFKALGFSFNPAFTDKNAACMIVGDNNFVMLLTLPFFEGFNPGRTICDRNATEVLVAISLESRAEVDEMVAKAIAAGGSGFREPQDHGFMYGHSFQDPDGHVWEPFYMDPTAIPQ